MNGLTAHRFDRNELAGSLSDLGTLLPLTIALVLINSVPLATTLLVVGGLYVFGGLYYHLPIPVQPLKVVSAVAIASQLPVETIAASGLILGVILLILAATGAIDLVAKVFTRPIVRGIQLGLGMILMIKGVEFVAAPELILNGPAGAPWLNPVVGVIGAVIVLIFVENKRFPAALLLLGFGVLVGLTLGERPEMQLENSGLVLIPPDFSHFWNAFFLLVLPQFPLTIGNAIISTRDVAITKFGEAKSARVTLRALLTSMGVTGLISGSIGAMPVCHGAGGLAAAYRFGARTGGSNLIIGVIAIVLALLFTDQALLVLTLIPKSILGVLLFFAGLELARMIIDTKGKWDLMTALAIASVSVATSNMGIGVLAGFAMQGIIIAKQHLSAGDID
ncbi:MAG: sulfate permease [Rhodobacteraceae bacterium]|nr:sulfate permease [Paracoccaceae bacterium]